MRLHSRIGAILALGVVISGLVGCDFWKWAEDDDPPDNFIYFEGVAAGQKWAASHKGSPKESDFPTPNPDYQQGFERGVSEYRAAEKNANGGGGGGD